MSDDGYIPFKERFRAWWAGEDPVVIRHAPDRAAPGKAKADPHALVVDAPGDDAPSRYWTPERLAIAQTLFGEEEVRPGGKQRSLDLVKPMALNKTQSARDLAAGLGGGTRAIHTELGVWIDGQEPDPELAEEAQRLGRARKLDKKVPIAAYDPGEPPLRGGKFNGILARDLLFTLPDPQGMLSLIDSALKPRGHVVISDYAFASPAKADSPTAKAWLAQEPRAPAPLTLEGYRFSMQRLGWDVRIFEDDSDPQLRHILGGWAAFMDGLAKPDLTRPFVSAMLLEAELWLHRARVLQAGAVRVVRIHAMKR